jgi:hypothetical protein
MFSHLCKLIASLCLCFACLPARANPDYTTPLPIFLGVHGIYFDLLAKVKRMLTEGEAAFIDPKGYVDAVNRGQAEFEKSVAAQRP